MKEIKISSLNGRGKNFLLVLEIWWYGRENLVAKIPQQLHFQPKQNFSALFNRK